MFKALHWRLIKSYMTFLWFIIHGIRSEDRWGKLGACCSFVTSFGGRVESHSLMNIAVVFSVLGRSISFFSLLSRQVLKWGNELVIFE